MKVWTLGAVMLMGCAAGMGDPGDRYDVLVRFVPAASPVDRAAIIRDAGAILVDSVVPSRSTSVRLEPIYLVRPIGRRSWEANDRIVAALQRSPLVELAGIDVPVVPLNGPSTPPSPR